MIGREDGKEGHERVPLVKREEREEQSQLGEREGKVERKEKNSQK